LADQVRDPLFKPKGLNPDTVTPPSGGGAQPPAQASQSVELSVGPIVADLVRAPNRVSVTLRARVKLELGIEICFDIADPHVQTHMDVRNGSIVSAGLKLTGFQKVSVSAAGGSANGLSDNFKVKAELPFDWNAPIVIEGIPFNLLMKDKFLIETAFSAKNSTITARGVYGLSGPLGFEYSAAGGMVPYVPNFTVLEKMMDSLRSISVGVNGLVFANQFKLQLGLGTAAANAGPYAGTTLAVGFTLGSDLGLIKCRGATLDLNQAVGFGFIISNAEIRKVLDQIKKEVKIETEMPVLSKNLVHREGIRPDVPLCTG
jgi:hypothetical protein